MSTYKKAFTYFLFFVSLICILVLGVGFLIMQSIKDSEPFKRARETAFQNPEIHKLSGGVTGTGFFVKGVMNEDSAAFNFTVSGKQNDLWVSCKLINSQPNSWEVKKLTYTLK